MTVHKVQGQTLPKVKILIDERKKPEYGQTLEALTRVKKLTDLVIMNQTFGKMFELTANG